MTMRMCPATAHRAGGGRLTGPSRRVRDSRRAAIGSRHGGPDDVIEERHAEDSASLREPLCHLGVRRDVAARVVAADETSARTDVANRDLSNHVNRSRARHRSLPPCSGSLRAGSLSREGEPDGRPGGRTRPEPGDEAEHVNGDSAEGAGFAEDAAAQGECAGDTKGPGAGQRGSGELQKERAARSLGAKSGPAERRD